jgi:tetratricopeptide (TPR) repeat protein
MKAAAVPDLGQPALSAFRADIPVGGGELSPSDNDTLAVATLLRHAAAAPKSAITRRMLREATRIAKQSLGKRRLAQHCDLDTPGFESPLDVFRMMSERCDENGQLHLEDHMLASLERLAVPASLTAGRIACRRARITLELGRLDLAQMQLEALLVNRLWKQFDEVRLRALLSLGGVAQARGNFPEHRRLVLRVVRLAGDRYPRMAAVGFKSLAVGHSLMHDFDISLQHFWKAYDLLKGRNDRRETEVLSDMSQALLDAGRPAAARAGFARLLEKGQRLAARNAFPLIGGYAVASAALGDRSGVEWATSQILLLAKQRGLQRQAADALFECSEALAAVGQPARAGTMRRRAVRLAERYGFHDLTFKAQPMAMKALPSPSPLTEHSEAVVGRVMEMEPDEMPSALVYAD